MLRAFARGYHRQQWLAFQILSLAILENMFKLYKNTSLF